MTPHKQFFDTYEPISGRKVFMGDNGMVEAVGKGSILVETRVKGRARSIRMHDVLHVPDLHSNLLSVSKLISKGLKVHFNSLGCVMRASNGEMLAVASLESNLYQLDTKVMNVGRIEFFGAFRGQLASFGTLAQEVGASQRQ